MRILLVEDNINIASEMERSLTGRGVCEVVWAKSRNTANKLLEEQAFDLLILDRRIPTADEMLDDDIVHGWNVFTTARSICPGLPIWFLTATEDPDFAADVINEFARQGDPHGNSQSEGMVRVFWKKRLDLAVLQARAFCEQVNQVSSIAVENLDGLNLTSNEEKNLRLFCRKNAGTAIKITGLSGGLSGARVLKVICQNASGQTRITSVAKIGKASAVVDELERYRRDVVRLLPEGFPQVSAQIEDGSGEISGVYYGLVGEQVESAFDLLKVNPEAAAVIPAELRRITGPWEKDARKASVMVSEIRRRIISDTKLAQLTGLLDGISIESVESVRLDAMRCCQHNDLHGENALSLGNGRMMLIDFNDVGESFAGFDPVTLSLSTIFHKNSGDLRLGWMNADKMTNWHTIDAYTVGCGFAKFIVECRKWANDVSGSTKATSALAYGYALRQLRYPDTDKDLARALIRSSIQHLTL